MRYEGSKKSGKGNGGVRDAMLKNGLLANLPQTGPGSTLHKAPMYLQGRTTGGTTSKITNQKREANSKPRFGHRKSWSTTTMISSQLSFHWRMRMSGLAAI